MKRTPIKRKTPMRRGGGLRRTRINPRNEERLGRNGERNFGPLADFVRKLPCDACGIEGRTQAAHVKSIGSGGHAWRENGAGNILALCVECHGLQHLGGWGAVPWSFRGEPIEHNARESRASAEGFAIDHGVAFIEEGGERY